MPAWTALTDRRRSTGFSLIELVMVVILVGIVGAIALPRFANASARQQLEAAARRVESDLQRAQQQSRALSHRVIISFNLEANSYLYRPAVGESFEVQLDESPYRVAIGAAAFNDAPALQFNGFGVPNAPGSVVLTSAGGQATIKLDATGGVTR